MKKVGASSLGSYFPDTDFDNTSEADRQVLMDKFENLVNGLCELENIKKTLINNGTTVRLISEQIQMVPSTNCFSRLLKSLGNKRYDWLFLEYVDLQNL